MAEVLTDFGNPDDLVRFTKRHRKCFDAILQKSAHSPAILREEVKAFLEDGNEYFKKGNLHEAIERYTYCIKFGMPWTFGESEVSLIIKRQVVAVAACNRAQAFLNLQLWDHALASASEAVRLDPDNIKGWYRKAKARMALQEFAKALEDLARALELVPANKAINDDLIKCQALLEQSRTGVFDPVGIICSGSVAPSLCDFVGPVEVKRSAGRGRGLFLTEKVEAGTLLVINNAFAIGPSSEGNTALIEEITRTCLASRKNTHQLHSLLAKDEEGPRKHLYIPPMEMFIPGSGWSPKAPLEIPSQNDLQSVGNFCFSAFSTACPVIFGGARYLEPFPERQGCRKISGLWILPGFVNHSCIPNCHYHFFGKAMVLRAAVTMDAGEELTLSYTSHLWIHRQLLTEKWKFSCTCDRCVFDMKFRSQMKELLSLEESFTKSFWKPDPEKTISEHVQEMRNLILRVDDEMTKLPMNLNKTEKNWIHLSFLSFYQTILQHGKRYVPRPEKLRICTVVFEALKSVGGMGSDWFEDSAVAVLYLTEAEYGKESKEYLKAREEVRQAFRIVVGLINDTALDHLLQARCSKYDLAFDLGK